MIRMKRTQASNIKAILFFKKKIGSETDTWSINFSSFFAIIYDSKVQPPPFFCSMSKKMKSDYRNCVMTLYMLPNTTQQQIKGVTLVFLNRII